MHANKRDEGPSYRWIFSPLPFDIPQPVVFIRMFLIPGMSQYVMLFFAGNITGSGPDTLIKVDNHCIACHFLTPLGLH